MSAEVTSPGPASRGPSASEKDRQEVHSALRGDQEPSAGSAEGVQTRGRKRLLERSAESEQDRSTKRAVRPAPLGLLAVLAAALSPARVVTRKVYTDSRLEVRRYEYDCNCKRCVLLGCCPCRVEQS